MSKYQLRAQSQTSEETEFRHIPVSLSPITHKLTNRKERKKIHAMRNQSLLCIIFYMLKKYAHFVMDLPWQHPNTNHRFTSSHLES